MLANLGAALRLDGMASNTLLLTVLCDNAQRYAPASTAFTFNQTRRLVLRSDPNYSYHLYNEA
jgi:hypothetical protein